MKRLIVIYNPNSSRFADVKEGVLDKIKDISGYLVGKYEIKEIGIEGNVKQLSKIIEDGDLVISAGGDATGVITVNSVLGSGKDVTVVVLPYGNFNDLSRTLGVKRIEDIIDGTYKSGKLYPLEIIVDGKMFRYATCYVTIGMTAEAVELYDKPAMREKLKNKYGRSVSSYTELVKWYLKNRHKKDFLPQFRLNGQLQKKGISDYVAVNGRYMARVMKCGNNYTDKKIFYSKVDKLSSLWRLVKLMARSLVYRIPGDETSGDVIEFESPATVKIHAEGEFGEFKNVKRIEVRKGEKCLKVINA